MKRFLRTLKAHVLKLPPGAAVEDRVRNLRAFPEVEYAEPDYRATIQPAMEE